MLSFEGIGTLWQVETAEPVVAEVGRRIRDRVDAFDLAYSRFRDDSLVSRLRAAPASVELPADAPRLFELYRKLYAATGGAVTPLVGASLERLGYDSAYRLTPAGAPVPAPPWEDAIAWDGRTLSALRPVTVDIGAAGKGYLVDLVSEMLVDAGHTEFVVDASGDLYRRGPGTIRVGLEHPADPTRAIGVVELGTGAVCASATNRRAWGDGLHHVIDPVTGMPATRVLATWALASTALEADGLATALFFTEPEYLTRDFDFQYVVVDSTGRVTYSPDLTGEIFT
ncbi:thiamine biosynthesis lipoprotein [Microbacteriaceae bacterium SG_E_30_P1]|uniref:FAD:protein FMN transferase n=1 Tax=Antiquaquibacter oligotrophicus TaxID=2880260 RepID=A0ABT6KJ53_9MICO|nr:FAD:protein FMN transferase [Antiquaquibacter oligotrophicus]MDH6180007.1 thiamine biosynthesis lipoprotein [Antiquaquibacter oligotrophicus]UDF14238.1 FAD:protein FMN transferase [Antiquaquibacter oligotrophicus]